MENIKELITLLEKLVDAEQDWHDAAYQQSKDMNFHKNFLDTDSLLHDATFKTIANRCNLEENNLLKAKSGLNALKEFYRATSDDHKAKAHKIFFIELDYAKQGVDAEKLQVKHSPNEKTRRAEEIYLNSLQIAKNLEQKLSKEQITAFFKNSELDETSVIELLMKFKEERAEYARRNTDLSMSILSEIELRQAGPEFPLLSKAKNYTLKYKLSGIADDEDQTEFVSITDQLAILQGHNILKIADLRWSRTITGAALYCHDKLVHEYNCAPENVCA